MSDAQLYKNCTWVVGDAGCGKTTAAIEYRRTHKHVLVQAADLRDAVKKLDAGMKGTMADYIICSVAETAIMDVFPCLVQKEE